MSDDRTDAGEAIHDEVGSPTPTDALLAEVCARVPGAGWDVSHGQHVVFVAPEHVEELGFWLRDERSFDMCTDVTAVDYLDHWDRPMGTWVGARTRFEVVVNLLDLDAPRRLRIRVPVAEDAPRCPTLSYVWASADAAEREVFDMFGIVFEGHPNLTRILMPDEWEGHPLRKDYALGAIPVTFKEGGAEQGAGRPPGPGGI